MCGTSWVYRSTATPVDVMSRYSRQCMDVSVVVGVDTMRPSHVRHRSPNERWHACARLPVGVDGDAALVVRVTDDDDDDDDDSTGTTRDIVAI
jgi:hypothetical protein